jgi:hypothetical protein
MHAVQLTTPLVASLEMLALHATSHAPRRVAYLHTCPARHPAPYYVYRVNKPEFGHTSWILV